MRTNPRQEIEKMIEENNIRGLFEKASEFHGHYCHKVAYGVKASLLALKELEIKSLKEEGGKIVAITDSPGPFCNGIQVVLGLSLGHSDFVIRDMGKLVLTLLKYDGSAVKVTLRPEFLDEFSRRNPEISPIFRDSYATISVPEDKSTPLTITQLKELMTEMVSANNSDEMEQMMVFHSAMIMKELDIPDEEMFIVEKKRLEFSKYAPVCQCTYPIIICESCGDVVFKPYIKIKNKKNLCIECAAEGYNMLAKGKIINIKPPRLKLKLK